MSSIAHVASLRTETLVPKGVAVKRIRRYVRPASLAAVVIALLVLGSTIASAAIVLHGHAELVVDPAETGGLEVGDVRLAAPLVPGGTADLVLAVRNRGTVPVAADRITASLPLKDARPAGCTSKVSGPLLTADGSRLSGQQRVVLQPGEQRVVTVPRAVRLAASSKTGCGFRLTLDVQAVQVVVPTTPAPTRPTTAPDTEPPTIAPTTAPTETPPLQLDDCDEADPACA
jgi:hypothetical protein